MRLQERLLGEFFKNIQKKDKKHEGVESLNLATK